MLLWVPVKVKRPTHLDCWRPDESGKIRISRICGNMRSHFNVEMLALVETCHLVLIGQVKFTQNDTHQFWIRRRTNVARLESQKFLQSVCVPWSNPVFWSWLAKVYLLETILAIFELVAGPILPDWRAKNFFNLSACLGRTLSFGPDWPRYIYSKRYWPFLN